MLGFVIQHHADGTLTDFRREFPRWLDYIGSNLSWAEASGKPVRFSMALILDPPPSTLPIGIGMARPEVVTGGAVANTQLRSVPRFSGMLSRLASRACESR